MTNFPNKKKNKKEKDLFREYSKDLTPCRGEKEANDDILDSLLCNLKNNKENEMYDNNKLEDAQNKENAENNKECSSTISNTENKENKENFKECNSTISNKENKENFKECNSTISNRKDKENFKECNSTLSNRKDKENKENFKECNSTISNRKDKENNKECNKSSVKSNGSKFLDEDRIKEYIKSELSKIKIKEFIDQNIEQCSFETKISDFDKNVHERENFKNIEEGSVDSKERYEKIYEFINKNIKDEVSKMFKKIIKNTIKGELINKMTNENKEKTEIRKGEVNNINKNANRNGGVNNINKNANRNGEVSHINKKETVKNSSNDINKDYFDLKEEYNKSILRNIRKFQEKTENSSTESENYSRNVPEEVINITEDNYNFKNESYRQIYKNIEEEIMSELTNEKGVGLIDKNKRLIFKNIEDELMSERTNDKIIEFIDKNKRLIFKNIEEELMSECNNEKDVDFIDKESISKIMDEEASHIKDSGLVFKNINKDVRPVNLDNVTIKICKNEEISDLKERESKINFKELKIDNTKEEVGCNGEEYNKKCLYCGYKCNRTNLNNHKIIHNHLNKTKVVDHNQQDKEKEASSNHVKGSHIYNQDINLIKDESLVQKSTKNNHTHEITNTHDHNNQQLLYNTHDHTTTNHQTCNTHDHNNQQLLHNAHDQLSKYQTNNTHDHNTPKYQSNNTHDHNNQQLLHNTHDHNNQQLLHNTHDNNIQQLLYNTIDYTFKEQTKNIHCHIFKDQLNTTKYQTSNTHDNTSTNNQTINAHDYNNQQLLHNTHDRTTCHQANNTHDQLSKYQTNNTHDQSSNIQDQLHTSKNRGDTKESLKKYYEIKKMPVKSISFNEKPFTFKKLYFPETLKNLSNLFSSLKSVFNFNKNKGLKSIYSDCKESVEKLIKRKINLENIEQINFLTDLKIKIIKRLKNGKKETSFTFEIPEINFDKILWEWLLKNKEKEVPRKKIYNDNLEYNDINNRVKKQIYADSNSFVSNTNKHACADTNNGVNKQVYSDDPINGVKKQVYADSNNLVSNISKQVYTDGEVMFSKLDVSIGEKMTLTTDKKENEYQHVYNKPSKPTHGYTDNDQQNNLKQSRINSYSLSKQNQSGNESVENIFKNVQERKKALLERIKRKEEIRKDEFIKRCKVNNEIENLKYKIDMLFLVENERILKIEYLNKTLNLFKGYENIKEMVNQHKEKYEIKKIQNESYLFKK